MLFLTLVLIPLSLLALSSAAAGSSSATYYVSPSGSDSNPGTSAAPWRTVNKVNNTSLAPGDTVLFQGGQTFSDATLMPSTSGTSSAPIHFGSYGSGRAQLDSSNGQDVWIPGGHHDLAFDNLDFTGSSNLFVSAASGSGVYDISLTNSSLHDTPALAVNIANTADHDWTISNVTINHTGDSAILTWGSNVTVSGSTISDAGWNTSISWAKHGVYAKGPSTTISGDDFSNIPNGQAISLRFHGARVYDNTIHDTPYAIGFFDYDTAAAPQGTNYVYDNRIWNVSGWGFYYSGQQDPQGRAPSVGFVVASNTFSLSGSAEAVNVSEVPGGVPVTLANNVFTGSFGSAYRGCSSCSENHNDWNGGSSNLPAGSGDVRLSPGLSSAPGLAPSSTSAVVDLGTTSLGGLSYSPGCDGAPLHYCGSAPDLGAVESTSSASAPPPPPTTTTTTTTPTPPPPPTTTTTTTTTPTTTTPTTTTPTTPAPSPPPPDTSAPSTPSALSVKLSDWSTGVSWGASTDDRGVTGYAVSLGGAVVLRTASLSASLPPVSCGSSYTVAVAAYDAAGNVSRPATASGTAPACQTQRHGRHGGSPKLASAALGATFGPRALHFARSGAARFTLSARR